MTRPRLLSNVCGPLRSSCRPTVLRRVPGAPLRNAFSSSSTLGSLTRRRQILTLTAAATTAITALALLRPQLLLDEETDPRLRSRHDHLEGTKQPSGQKLISFEEVQKHNTAEDCWVVINGNVYDVTTFLENHPGGAEVIVANAGKDASKIFQPIHPPDALDLLDDSQHLGPVDPLTVPAAQDAEPTEEEKRIEAARKEMPDVHSMLLLDDFEYWGQKVLSGTAWAYYRSAADREITFNNNAEAFKQYYFRPRILHSVTNGSINTNFMGVASDLPIFISPAAMAKLGHPLGEVNLTKGAGECGIVQGISINASCSLDEIMAARKEGQKVFFQIYLNKDRKASEALLEKVTKLGAAAVIFTVDAGWRSKRTLDVRAKTSVQAPIKTSGEGASAAKSASPLGVSQAISGYQDTNLTWGDIDFIRKNTPLPIIVKGVQCVEDVEKCVEAGVQGVIISNHGGRQLDYAPAPIDILYELRANRPDLFSKIDIMIDGGVRSGADVVKCLALGAKAVGLGRPFLYANGTHGQDGVVRVCQILAEEITNSMRNCGVTQIKDLKPEMVGPAGPWIGQNRPVWKSTP